MRGFRIAVYGKGGIGKSTVSANLATALAAAGHRVVLMGCDPKRDTTRQVAGRDPPVPVSEYIVSTPPAERRLDDVVKKGARGVLCIEAGGPKPGSGCAGKGITAAFETLDALGADSLDPDYVIYDVLGDVVCGGFAVPMRPSNSDALLVVTSGEPMSVYAANNILRGSLSFEGGSGRWAGIVLNRRGIAGEGTAAHRFARAVGLPVLADLTRSGLVIEADRAGRTVYDMFPLSSERECFDALAELVSCLSPGCSGLRSPTPLTDGELEGLVSGAAPDVRGTYRRIDVPVITTDPSSPPAPPRANRIGRGPMGALATAFKVPDVPVVVHGPASCALTGMSELASIREGWSEGVGGSGGNVVSTNMDARSTVFGGNEALEATLRPLAERGEKLVVLLTTCVPEMIGDDVSQVVSRIESEHPGTRIVTVHASRSESGGYAHMDVVRALAGLVDPSVEPEPRTVAIVDDTFYAVNCGRNLRYIDSLLSRLGLRRVPGFLGGGSAADISGLRRASLAFLGEDRRENREIRGILESKGMRFMRSALPRGMRATKAWLMELGSEFSIEEEAEGLASEASAEYRSAVARYSPDLRGRRVAVVDAGPWEVEWILESLADAGADATAVGTDADIGGFDLVVGGSKGARRIPAPETSATHLACVDLLKRASGALRSRGGRGWESWGDAA